MKRFRMHFYYVKQNKSQKNLLIQQKTLIKKGFAIL
jgi:hypothetical protein